MNSSRRTDLTFAVITFAFVAFLLFVGLQSFGIWDPWELTVADNARKLLAGDALTFSAPPLGVELVRFGFQLFGTHEWAGRFPVAILGLATLGVTFAIARAASDSRAAIYSVAVAGTSPLFLFNAKEMLGHSGAFLAQGIVAYGAMRALGIGAPEGSNESTGKRFGFLAAACLVGVPLAIAASGALIGVLPPLAAVVGAMLIDKRISFGKSDGNQQSVFFAASAVLVVLTGLVVHAFLQKEGDVVYGWAVGGVAHGANAPSFESVIQRVFHSFAPWSALLPLALGRMFVRDTTAESQSSETSLRSVVLLWASFGYGAQTLYEAHCGITAFTALIPIAIAVALFLRDIERSHASTWAAGITAFFFTGLIIRDFALYPSGPVEGLGIEGVTVPEIFNPKIMWAAVLGLFALAAALGIGIGEGDGKIDPQLQPRFLRETWGRSLGFKIWITLGAAIALGILAFGFACITAGDKLGLPLIAVHIGRDAIVIPFAVPIGVLAGQAVVALYQRFSSYRIVPVLVLGAVVGGYSALGFLPGLSEQFSPREIYDAFNKQAKPGEPLAEFRVGGRAASYYAHGSVQEVASEGDLINFLAGEGRKWAAFPADQLPSLNRLFRQRTGKNLFVLDAHSARVLLAANEVIPGAENKNFIAKYVSGGPEFADVSHPPDVHPQFPVVANFEDKLQFLGYDLVLPHDGYVGGGEHFRVKWYFRMMKPIPTSYKMFVHIDGLGNRLNGDHDPIDDKYPLRLWNPGDIVIDEQDFGVPGNYRPGTYDIFFGFFAGESRLAVTSGPSDGTNRVSAGKLQVR